MYLKARVVGHDQGVSLGNPSAKTIVSQSLDSEKGLISFVWVFKLGFNQTNLNPEWIEGFDELVML